MSRPRPTPGPQLPAWLAPYSKSVSAFVGAAGAALLVALPDGITAAEWSQAGLAGLGALGITYIAPANRRKD